MHHLVVHVGRELRADVLVLGVGEPVPVVVVEANAKRDVRRAWKLLTGGRQEVVDVAVSELAAGLHVVEHARLQKLETDVGAEVIHRTGADLAVDAVVHEAADVDRFADGSGRAGPGVDDVRRLLEVFEIAVEYGQRGREQLALITVANFEHRPALRRERVDGRIRPARGTIRRDLREVRRRTECRAHRGENLVLLIHLVADGSLRQRRCVVERLVRIGRKRQVVVHLAMNPELLHTQIECPALVDLPGVADEDSVGRRLRKLVAALHGTGGTGNLVGTGACRRIAERGRGKPELVVARKRIVDAAVSGERNVGRSLAVARELEPVARHELVVAEIERELVDHARTVGLGDGGVVERDLVVEALEPAEVHVLDLHIAPIESGRQCF